MSDPSTETWRETIGMSTSAQLRQTQRDLAASQADLSRMQADRDAVSAIADMLRAELTDAQKPCAWRDLAVDAMRERDLSRAQLDDAIAEFRAEKEKS